MSALRTSPLSVQDLARVRRQRWRCAVRSGPQWNRDAAGAARRSRRGADKRTGRRAMARLPAGL